MLYQIQYVCGGQGCIHSVGGAIYLKQLGGKCFIRYSMYAEGKVVYIQWVVQYI